MGKLVLIALLVSVAAAELSLFPDDTAFIDGIYDEDALTAQIFGSRHRRQTEENDPCGDGTKDIWGHQIIMTGPRGRHGPRPPPPPPPQEGAEPPTEVCPPPPPPPPSNSSEDAEDGPPRPGPPGGGPHHRGPPPGGPPHGRGPPPGHKRPEMVRCCNITIFMNDELLSSVVECRKEIAANFTEKEQRGPRRPKECAPWLRKKVIECAYNKLGWVSDAGVDGTKVAEMAKSLGAEPEIQKLYEATFTACSGKNVTDFNRCVIVTLLAKCPEGYEAGTCTEECAAWKERASSMK